MNNKDSQDRVTQRIRRVARIWSLVVIGFTLVMAIAHIVEPHTNDVDYPPIENLLPLLMCLSVAALGLAWRWEVLAGALNIGFYLINLGLYWYLRGRFFPLGALAILSLAIVPGVLFLVCWWRTKPRAA